MKPGQVLLAPALASAASSATGTATDPRRTRNAPTTVQFITREVTSTLIEHVTGWDDRSESARVNLLFGGDMSLETADEDTGTCLPVGDDGPGMVLSFDKKGQTYSFTLKDLQEVSQNPEYDGERFVSRSWKCSIKANTEPERGSTIHYQLFPVVNFNTKDGTATPSMNVFRNHPEEIYTLDCQLVHYDKPWLASMSNEIVGTATGMT